MAFTINGSTGLTFPDGTVQAVAAGLVNVQTFNASGTWTKPASGSMARIQVWGGGRGGSRASSGGAAGGLGGGYSEITVPLSTLASTVTVTVGAAGVGRTGTAGTGTVGGDSTFGSLVGAKGGQAGGGQPFNPVTGVQTFTGNIWDGGTDPFTSASQLYGGGCGAQGFNMAGNYPYFSTSLFGGDGGAGAGNNIAAVAGSTPGGGGGGGYSTGLYANGANGGSGRIIVTVW
jgi:hypothetical protein